jgi:hypothetical protein
MPRYKIADRCRMFFPVILREQIVPGSVEFALNHLMNLELDLSKLYAQFNYDQTGASAYDPQMTLKIV